MFTFMCSVFLGMGQVWCPLINISGTFSPVDDFTHLPPTLLLKLFLVPHQHLIHIHLLIPPFSSFIPLYTPVYSCHQLAFISSPSTVSHVRFMCYLINKYLWLQTWRHGSPDASAFAFADYFFFSVCLRLNVDQWATWPPPVGVCRISATLSAQVWLMMATICCPILPVASSHVSSPNARRRMLIPKIQCIMFLISLHIWGLCVFNCLSLYFFTVTNSHEQNNIIQLLWEIQTHCNFWGILTKTLIHHKF